MGFYFLDHSICSTQIKYSQILNKTYLVYIAFYTILFPCYFFTKLYIFGRYYCYTRSAIYKLTRTFSFKCSRGPTIVAFAFDEADILPSKIKFFPINLATKGDAGLKYMSCELPICSTRPEFITTILSPIPRASDCAWVTKRMLCQAYVVII